MPTPSTAQRLRDWFSRTFFFPSGGRLDALEGVRGLAILLVVSNHFSGDYSGENFNLPEGSMLAEVLRVLSIGHQGVDLFFMLSAFLIFSSASRGRFDAARFLDKRAHRIFPAHLIAIAGWIALQVVSQYAAVAVLAVLPLAYWALSRTDAFRAHSHRLFVALVFVMPLTLVVYQLLAPAGSEWRIQFGVDAVRKGLLEMSLASTFIDSHINANPTWSLSLELFFYLLVPLLLRVFRRFGGSYLALAALLFVPSFLAGWLWPDQLLPGERFMAFCFGIAAIAIARRMESDADLRKAIGGWGALAIAGLVGCQVSFIRVYQFPDNPGPVLFYLACDLVFALLVVGALSGRGPVYRLCMWWPLRFIGNISFSLYLLHALVIVISRPYLHARSFAGMWLDALLTFAACLAAACYSFYFVEREYFQRRHAQSATKQPPRER